MELFHNPSFVAYIHALIDLHVLMMRGLDDGPDADAIRDKSDVPWANLSVTEQAKTSSISEFMYGIKGFFQSPSFIAYIHTLIDLRAALVRGMFGTEDVHEILDKLDTLRIKLSSSELQAANEAAKLFRGIK